MNQEEHMTEAKLFVEDAGLFFEELGLQRMAGRILGWLLVCDPPHQSIDDLCEVLMASKGSISTMTRLLVQLGVIERLSLPGVRRDFFRIRLSADELVRRGVSQFAKMRRLSERGLKLIDSQNVEVREQLESIRDMSAFLEGHIAPMVERWKEDVRLAGQQDT